MKRSSRLLRPLVQALMTLRGVDQVVAMTLVAELGELKRFAHPRELMGYLGLVPCEHTSGEKRRLGGITKNWQHPCTPSVGSRLLWLSGKLSRGR